MITDKTRDKLAELSAQPIKCRPRTTAYEGVVDNFCLRRCSHTPDGELCGETKPARSKYKWAPEELEYLSDHYGLLLDETIARNLGRSVYGVAWAAYKLKLRRKDNLYTATELARVLGIAEPETVIGWVQRGWLKCRRGPLKAGLNRAWVFTEGTVAKFLRQRPWVVNLGSMDEHYFRSVVEIEGERNPWYTCQQAASLLGVKAGCTVEDYIHRGWLPADKKPWGCHGAWIIRFSAIEKFLANDPRPLSNHYTNSEARRRSLLKAGRASMLAVTWVIECPSCGQQVRVMAPPQLRGAAVRQRFIRLFVNGNCEHGNYCLVSTGTPTVAPLSRATRARRAASACIPSNQVIKEPEAFRSQDVEGEPGEGR